MGLNFCMLKNVDGSEVAINPVTVTAVRPSSRDTTIVAYAGGELKVSGIVGEVILKLLAAAGARGAPEGHASHLAS